MTTPPPPLPTTPAFRLQAAISFGVSVVAVGVGVAYLPVDRWIRALLALGLLYVVTSTFTLAKTVRDAQEAQGARRLEEQRRDRMLGQHDPYAVTAA